jgi:hypothetical protein
MAKNRLPGRKSRKLICRPDLEGIFQHRCAQWNEDAETMCGIAATLPQCGPSPVTLKLKL